MGRAPELRDRHVIVTGGSSGIGLALVRRVRRTRSTSHRRTSRSASGRPRIKPISPEVVADAILDGVARRRKRIFPGRWTWVLARVANGSPWIGDWIADRAVARAATRPARGRG